MKTIYRFLLLAMVINTLLFSSCKKEESYMNTGVITGYDLRDCICCGGLMMNFRNDTVIYHGDFYLLDNDPSEFGININSSFPIDMKVDWVADSLKCSNSHIKITKFKIL